MTAAALSPRQREVLVTVVRLDSRKCAAAELGISRGMLYRHLRECCHRLGVASPTQAAIVAVRLGIIAEADVIRTHRVAHLCTCPSGLAARNL